MRMLRVVLGLAMLVGFLAPAGPAAAAVGVVSVKVSGTYVSGTTGDLPGATVTLHNLDTGQNVVLTVQGDPTVSPFHASAGVPYGRYLIAVERPGFVTQYWPTAYSREAAIPVWVADAPNCDETSPAPCPVHRLEIQLREGLVLGGRLRMRDGRGVGNAVVSAQRTDEPTYRPSTVTSADGAFTMLLPPGTYNLAAPGRRVMADTPVVLDRAVVRDLVLLAPPGPVSDVTIAPGDSRLSVSWRPPADDGGSPITGYRVVATPGGVQCTTTATGCTLEGLQNGQLYRVSVTAENDIGPGEPSLSGTPVAPSAGLPSRVRNVRVASGNKSLAVTWSAPTRGDATEYVARALPGGRSCSTADLQCTILGLRNGTPYRVEVIARSDAGRTDPVAAPHRVRPAGPPSAPRNVKARPAPRSLRVSWSKPLDDGGLRVRRYVATVWPGGRTCSTTHMKCRVRGLDPRTNYSVTVRARTRAGDGAISPGSVPVRPGR